MKCCWVIQTALFKINPLLGSIGQQSPGINHHPKSPMDRIPRMIALKTFDICDMFEMWWGVVIQTIIDWASCQFSDQGTVC